MIRAGRNLCSSTAAGVLESGGAGGPASRRSPPLRPPGATFFVGAVLDPDFEPERLPLGLDLVDRGLSASTWCMCPGRHTSSWIEHSSTWLPSQAPQGAAPVGWPLLPPPPLAGRGFWVWAFSVLGDGAQPLLCAEGVDLKLQPPHLNRKFFPGAIGEAESVPRPALRRLRRTDFHKGRGYYYR